MDLAYRGGPMRSRLFWFALGSGATVGTYLYMRPRVNIRERLDKWKEAREARRADREAQRAERGETGSNLKVSARDAFSAAKEAFAQRREAKAEKAAAAASEASVEPVSKDALPPPRTRILARMRKDKTGGTEEVANASEDKETDNQKVKS